MLRLYKRNRSDLPSAVAALRMTLLFGIAVGGLFLIAAVAVFVSAV